MRLREWSSDVCSSDLHGQRADVLPGDQLRQVAPLLLGAAVAAELVHAEIGMRPVAEADTGRGAADLLHRHAVLQVAHAGAAVVPVHRQAEQAERAHLRRSDEHTSELQSLMRIAYAVFR